HVPRQRVRKSYDTVSKRQSMARYFECSMVPCRVLGTLPKHTSCLVDSNGINLLGVANIDLPSNNSVFVHSAVLRWWIRLLVPQIQNLDARLRFCRSRDPNIVDVPCHVNSYITPITIPNTTTVTANTPVN